MPTVCLFFTNACELCARNRLRQLRAWNSILLGLQRRAVGDLLSSAQQAGEK